MVKVTVKMDKNGTYIKYLGSKTYPNESTYHFFARYSTIGKVLLMARNSVPAKRFPMERRVGTHICKTLTFLFHSILVRKGWNGGNKGRNPKW